MKTLLLVTFLGSFTALGQQIKPTPTAQDVLQLREFVAQQNQNSRLKRVETEVEIRKTSTDFMDTSEYLVGARGFTILPKGSVLTIGRDYQQTNTQPKDVPYVEWKQFIQLHRAGLKLHNVQLTQLQSKGSFEDIKKVKAACEQAGVTCITVYQLNPVKIANQTTSRELTQNK